MTMQMVLPGISLVLAALPIRSANPGTTYYKIATVHLKPSISSTRGYKQVIGAVSPDCHGTHNCYFGTLPFTHTYGCMSPYHSMKEEIKGKTWFVDRSTQYGQLYFRSIQGQP